MANTTLSRRVATLEKDNASALFETELKKLSQLDLEVYATLSAWGVTLPFSDAMQRHKETMTAAADAVDYPNTPTVCEELSDNELRVLMFTVTWQMYRGTEDIFLMPGSRARMISLMDAWAEDFGDVPDALSDSELARRFDKCAEQLDTHAPDGSDAITEATRRQMAECLRAMLAILRA